LSNQHRFWTSPFALLVVCSALLIISAMAESTAGVVLSVGVSAYLWGNFFTHLAFKRNNPGAYMMGCKPVPNSGDINSPIASCLCLLGVLLFFIGIIIFFVADIEY